VYGAVRSNGGTASSKQGFVGSLGHVSDDNGLIYMRARYYDSNLGRFESEDPGFQSRNWFLYCNDNPVDLTDSNGKEFNPAEPGLTLFDLKEMYDDYKETIALSFALDKCLKEISDAKESDEVEDSWGEFMKDWCKNTGLGDVMKQMAEYGGSGAEVADTAYLGTEIGIKLTMLCIGYQARIDWYAENCDGD
jgi:RHS repeat-associated protein